MDLDRIIQSRKSCRKFSSKKPDWRDIIQCIDSMRYAPMAGNNFSLKTVLVNEKDKINKIAKASQQDFINKSGYVLVVYSEPSRVKSNFGERGEKYLAQQAGAAIQNFLLKVEEKGLSTCWIGHFVEDEIKSELKIPKTGKVEAIFPIGYSTGKIDPQRKTNLDSILYFNKSGERYMKGKK